MSNQENPIDPQNALTILDGGVEIEVFHIDRMIEIVKVRQLPLRLMAAYGNAQAEEDKLIALFCDKPHDWPDRLTQESQERIVEIGDRLNLDPFFRWAQRRRMSGERLQPLVTGQSKG